ncbi:TlpA family protein disulfide reductase [Chloroflexota bacterium]
MKIGTKQILSVILIIAFIGSVQACTSSNSSQSIPQTTTDEASSNPQLFEVSSFSINPPQANTGVQIIATARITNIGSTTDKYSPRLRIDDVTKEVLPSFLVLDDVEITAGTAELLSFVFSSNTSGTFKATWGKLAAEFTVVGGGNNDAGKNNVDIKVAVPDFNSLDVVTDQEITLSSFKGSAVLLNFVNYGCDPSLNEVVSEQLMVIRELQDQRDDFVPVSVFCGCCPEDVLREFAEQNSFIWPWILDSDYSIVNDYESYLRTYGYPTLIFIDQEQYIREVAGSTSIADLSTKLDQVIGINN